MKRILYRSILLIAALALHLGAIAQNADTLYTKEYEQKFRIMPHLSYSTVQARDNGVTYSPNSPMAIGFGVAIKNTFLDFKFGYGFIPLRGEEYGKTQTLDLQLHNYNKKFLFDFFYQNYIGFYGQTDEGVQIYNEMELYQLGVEATYILNSDRYSAEAAFEQSVIQLKSAGSIVVGGGAYGYRVLPAKLDGDSENPGFIDNAQLGLNAGYAYSWVMNPSLMMSGMATVGANFGNEPARIEDYKFKVFPTVFARYSLAYHKANWALAFILLVHNKAIYPNDVNNINITTTRLEMCYVRHFNQVFKKKK